MDKLMEILADVKVEGDTDPFKDVEKEPQSDSLPENKPEGDEPTGAEVPVDEKPVPFHEHPRWKEREQELKELRERDEEREAKLQELESKLAPKEHSAIPDWFVELYGDNQVAWAKYSEHSKAEREEIKQEIIREQISQQTKEQEEAAHWQRWVDNEIDSLKAEHPDMDPNKLKKIMLDYRPTDEKGNFDFKAGYKIYEAIEKPSEKKPDIKTEAHKEIADAVTASSPQGEKPKKDFMTTADLRGRTMMSL